MAAAGTREAAAVSPGDFGKLIEAPVHGRYGNAVTAELQATARIDSVFIREKDSLKSVSPIQITPHPQFRVKLDRIVLGIKINVTNAATGVDPSALKVRILAGEAFSQHLVTSTELGSPSDDSTSRNIEVDLSAEKQDSVRLVAKLYRSEPNELSPASQPIDLLIREPFPRPEITGVAATGEGNTTKPIQRTTTAEGALYRTAKSEVSIAATESLDKATIDTYRAALNAGRMRLYVAKAGDLIPVASANVAIPDGGQPKGTIPVDLSQYFAFNERLTLFVRLETADGKNLSDYSLPVHIQSRTDGPKVQAILVSGAAAANLPLLIEVQFDPASPLDPVTVKTVGSFVLKTDAKDSSAIPASSITFNEASNSVALEWSQLSAGKYVFEAMSALKDVFGIALASSDSNRRAITRQFGDVAPTTLPGLRGTTGKYVNYKEYTEPRENPEGFNPSDHVETRVSRLYYYRDAHRVAQIVNRNSRSYNRAAVEMAAQLADKSRTEADQLTGQRRHAEEVAILAAQATRRAEAELQQQEQKQARANQELIATQQALLPMEQRQQFLTARITQLNNNPSRTAAEDKELSDLTKEQAELASQAGNATQARDTLAQIANNANQNIANLRAQVDQLREKENADRLQTLQLQEQEDRGREEQFRREVAAAHEDPDTYAPGVPGSDDPVEQVSVSVIGEGLIQLRGPIKGINIIRNTINQMDSPVGQVRIDVHSMQINGEDGSQMELAADEMQIYVDQARFLTTQSAELLRRAVVEVAAQCAQSYPGNDLTQATRDERYLYAFFGADFTNELRAMDSEFLHTGNKILSLHSMDTTSLSSALFLMALAKNDTRARIVARFQELVQCQLPQAEQQFIEAGLFCSPHCKLEDCHKLKLVPLAGNAKFQSVQGFFNAEFCNPDTMTPIQREFIRLAQIFKSQLITEMELRQRVMERGIIEDRFVSRKEQQRRAVTREEDTKAQVSRVSDRVAAQTREVLKAVAAIEVKIVEVETAVQAAADIEGVLRSAISEMDNAVKLKKFNGEIGDVDWTIDRSRPDQVMPRDAASVHPFLTLLASGITRARSLQEGLAFSVSESERELWDTNVKFTKSLEEGTNERLKKKAVIDKKDGFVGEDYAVPLQDIRHLASWLKELKSRGDGILEELRSIRTLLDQDVAGKPCLASSLADLIRQLSDGQCDVRELRTIWMTAKSRLTAVAPGEWPGLDDLVNNVDQGMNELLVLGLEFTMAQETAEDSRRPLDHVKFLDMLVDDLEDKHIELLEGTRAHTANIDNYIKRICTALQDDYNRQFYYPAMRLAREASRNRPVTFAQLETTGILANNRMFAKVAPQATMEFDLPRRDILLKEGLEGAKAAMDDYGALLNDPTFLSLAAIGSGLPTSSPLGGASGGFGTVRNVLPGLDASSGEQILNQTGPGRSELGSNLEALIPDPAIYKFETGTGYEIRPVIQPDGQAVVFHFNYMYTTHVREPVRADEKHLGRVKRQFIDTDVQLSNYELREISRYQVALKASRTSRGVPLLEDIPVAGALFRPLPQQEASLQQNVILGQAVIFPTLFDLMGLRWAPAVADLDPMRVSNEEFIVRGRHRYLQNRVYDYSSSQVDEFLRIPEASRRSDLYRTQESIPAIHPNGYQGPGLDYQRSELQEGLPAGSSMPPSGYIPGSNPEGAPYLQRPARPEMYPQVPNEGYPNPPVLPVPVVPTYEPAGSVPSSAEPIPTPNAQPDSSTSPAMKGEGSGAGEPVSGVNELRVKIAEPTAQGKRTAIYNALRRASQR